MTTSFLCDGGSVLLEKQGSSTTATYTYGNALIRKDGETPLFDGLGSERTVTSSSQAVTASLTLSAFGQTVASTGSSTSAYQFGATSGYRMEGDAGLTLVGCRFYDAQVGRFITRDTYLDQKPYAYWEGDPVNHLDPTGHFPGLVILVIVLFCGPGVVVILSLSGCASRAPVSSIRQSKGQFDPSPDNRQGNLQSGGDPFGYPDRNGGTPRIGPSGPGGYPGYGH